jgi:hypothetical protein
MDETKIARGQSSPIIGLSTDNKRDCVRSAQAERKSSVRLLAVGKLSISDNR